MLGDYRVTWFEEALRPDDVEGFKELRASSPGLGRFVSRQPLGAIGAVTLRIRHSRLALARDAVADRAM